MATLANKFYMFIKMKFIESGQPSLDLWRHSLDFGQIYYLDITKLIQWLVKKMLLAYICHHF